MNFHYVYKSIREKLKVWLGPGYLPSGMQPLELSEEQRRVFKLLENTTRHTFITGKAGTGKSLVLTHFAKYSAKNVVITAPTGLAALNIGGQTLHSLFKLPIGLIENKNLRLDEATRHLLSAIDTLLIDEISMVRADLIDGIDYLLRKAKHSDLPFGGTQIIAFGDLFQLPPIAQTPQLQQLFSTTYSSPYFFDAHAWRKTKLYIYELQEVFRQTDVTFKQILNAMRSNRLVPEQLATLNQQVGVASKDLDQTILTTTNNTAQLINETKLKALKGRSRNYVATITGTIGDNVYPCDKNIALKRGAQVVFIKNDHEKRWVNGTVGIVKSLSKSTITVAINKKTVEVLPVIWEKLAYTYNERTDLIEQKITATYTQLPVRLAWAMTIHKSQGCTYDRVTIDLGRGAFAHGQTYVALSRCRTLAGLKLKSAIESKDIIIDPRVVDFMSNVRDISAV